MVKCMNWMRSYGAKSAGFKRMIKHFAKDSLIQKHLFHLK